MIIISHAQGTPEWHAHRANHFNASDVPAMLGLPNAYRSRNELIAEVATGITKEVDAATQRRFDDGHRFEALARPLAEKIIGEDLFPVTGTQGKLSASFDGLTMLEDIAFEHKTLNAMIRNFDSADDLDEIYKCQMEQQAMVSGCEKVLFMATKWDSNDQLLEEKNFWYIPNETLRAAIIAGWAQFEKDLAAYVPVEVIPAAVATPTLDLPMVSIKASGSIAIISNLTKFGEALSNFIGQIPTKPSNDQEFADCKSAIGKLKLAEETLDSEEARAISQMEEIEVMRREKKVYFELSRTTRLALEKLVTAREQAIKVEIAQEARDALAEHIASLDKRLGGKLMPVFTPNFAEAMKNKRTVSSLRNAVDTELARCKIETSATADRIEINKKAMDSAESAFLFPDFISVSLKENDDFANVIAARKAAHKQAEDARLAAEREKIRAEEQAKAEAASRAELERARKEIADAQAAELARVAAEANRVAAEEIRRIDAERQSSVIPAPEVAQPVAEIKPANDETSFSNPVPVRASSKEESIRRQLADCIQSLTAMYANCSNVFKLADELAVLQVHLQKSTLNLKAA